MTRPKGLLKVCESERLACPTMHYRCVECSSEFEKLSNLKFFVTFARSLLGGWLYRLPCKNWFEVLT